MLRLHFFFFLNHFLHPGWETKKRHITAASGDTTEMTRLNFTPERSGASLEENIGSGGSFNMEGNGVSMLYCATLAGLVKFAAKQQLGKCSRSTRPEYNYAHFQPHGGRCRKGSLQRKSFSVFFFFIFFFLDTATCNLGSQRGDRVSPSKRRAVTPPAPCHPRTSKPLSSSVIQEEVTRCRLLIKEQR